MDGPGPELPEDLPGELPDDGAAGEDDPRGPRRGWLPHGAERRRASSALLTLAVLGVLAYDLPGGLVGDYLRLLVALAASVLLHEAGHAVAAYGVGGRVREVRIGSGPRLTPSSWWLDLRPLPTSGHVRHTLDARRPRWRRAVVSAAGLVVNAVLALAAVAALPSPAAQAVLTVNLMLLAANALPHGWDGSDGTKLWELARGGDPDGLAGDPLARHLLAGYRGHLAHWGVAATEEGLAHLRPQQAAFVRGRLVADALQCGDWPTAALLARGPVPGRWALPGAYAEAEGMAMLLHGGTDPARLAAAEAAAAGELVALPERARYARAAVGHSLALVRLAAGRDQEADLLCHRALPGVDAPSERAAVLATQGLARLGLGRGEDAVRLARAARRSDPDSPLLGLLERRLAAAAGR